MEVRQVDFNEEFITRMLSRLEWPVVKQAAVMVSIIIDGISSVPISLTIDNVRPMDWKHVTCAHII